MTIRLALAAALAAIVTIPVMAQLQKKEIAGTPNYSRVGANVGFGGQVEPAAMARLKIEGFVSVINLRRDTESGADTEADGAEAKAAGLKYIHLPFNAASPEAKVVESFLAAVADRSNLPVFIYSGSGNRVGTLWMIKRALQDQWPVDKALAEAKAIGLNNPDLVTFATEYISTHK